LFSVITLIETLATSKRALIFVLFCSV